MELSLGKYYLWYGETRYSAIHAKKRGRIALVKGDKYANEIVAKVNSYDELLAALKLAYDAFEKNYCIDWSEIEEAIKKAELSK